MKLTVELQKNLGEIIGTPIEFKPGSKDFIGTVLEYNNETGQTLVEVDDKRIQEIFPSLPIGVSSRKFED